MQGSRKPCIVLSDNSAFMRHKKCSTIVLHDLFILKVQLNAMQYAEASIEVFLYMYNLNDILIVPRGLRLGAELMIELLYSTDSS